MADPTTQLPDDFIQLDFTPAERDAAERATLPAWAQSAIDALAKAPTMARVGDIIAPIRAQAECPAKDAVRKAKDAAIERIRAANRALIATLALVWFNLWGWAKRVAPAVAHAPVTSAFGVNPLVPNTTPAEAKLGSRERPHGNATYSKLRNGEWGARVRHGASQPVEGGSYVLVTRKNGSTQLHTVAHVWWTDGTNTLVAVGEAPKAPSIAPNPERAAQLEAQLVAGQRQAIPVIAAESAQEPSGTVESGLASIAAESASNANVQSAGSLAGGQLRGVGFATDSGYVTALRNGVKQATAESYKLTLRDSYGYTDEQIAALTVTIIPEASLPVGRGITHTPQGKSYADMTPAERRALNPARVTAQAEAAKQEAKARVMFIAGLVRSGQGLIVSPGEAAHGVSLPAPQLRAALAAIGREDIAPRIKSNKAQFGEVMQSLNGNGLKAWAVIRKDVKLAGEEWPADVVSRWIVGTLDGSGSLGSMGDKLLVAELTRDDEIRFAGGSDSLRQRVVSAFEVRATEQAYNSTDLLNWFRGVLHTEHHALKNGGFLFVPGTEEQIQPVLDFIDAVKGLLGRSIGLGFAQSHKTMRDGLAESLTMNVAKLGREWQLKKDQAAKRERDKAIAAKQSPQEQELAARRAVVLTDAAGSSLRDCAAVAETIEGYAAMLGDAVKPARQALAALRAEIEPLCDDTSLRGAMLELD